MMRTKLSMSGTEKRPIARSPPGARLSRPVSVWHFEQAAAKTACPCRDVDAGGRRPPQPQRASARIAAAPASAQTAGGLGRDALVSYRSPELAAPARSSLTAA